MHNTNSNDGRQQMLITNRTNSDMVIVIEPWGDEQVLSPTNSTMISYSGPVGGSVEVEVEGSKLIIHGWEGSVVEFGDDLTIGADKR